MHPDPPAQHPGYQSPPGHGASTGTKKAFGLVAVVFFGSTFLVGVAAFLFLLSGGPDGAAFVVRVSTPVPAGAELEAGHLSAMDTPVEYIEPHAFTGDTGEEAIEKAMAASRGNVLLVPVYVGQQLRAEQFGPPVDPAQE